MPDDNAQKNRIREYFTLSFCLTAVSQLSHILYYGHFGIQPLQFFEPAEIVVNSIKDFVLISVVYFLYLFLTLLVIIITDFLKNRVYVGIDGEELIVVKEFAAKKKSPIIKNSRVNRLKSIFFGSSRRSVLSWMTITVIGMTTLTSIILYNFARDQGRGLIVFGIFLDITTLFFVVIMSVNHWQKKYEKAIPLEPFYKSLLSVVSPILFLTVWVYIMLIFAFSYIKARSAVLDNNYIGTKFYTQTDTITIDKNKLLIGRSKEWLFIYLRKNKATRVIRRSDLRNEIIINKNKGLFGVLFQNY